MQYRHVLKLSGQKKTERYLITYIWRQTYMIKTRYKKLSSLLKRKDVHLTLKKYITALESCTPENIKKGLKKYRDKKCKKIFNTLGIVLLILGVAGGFILMPLAVLVVPGIILMVSYRQKKEKCGKYLPLMKLKFIVCY